MLQADSWEALLGRDAATGGAGGSKAAAAEAPATPAAAPALRWVPEQELAGLGLSTSVRKVLSLAEKRR